MDRVKINMPNGGYRAGTDAKVSIKPGSVFDLEGVGLEVELCTGNFKQTAPAAEPSPFDLEAAKAGAPLVARNGKPAVFVAHDMGASKEYRVLVRIFGNDCVTPYDEQGVSRYGSNLDLFMAPKPKRTVWVNLYKDHSSCYHESPEEAQALALDYAIARAVPIEIDA